MKNPWRWAACGIASVAAVGWFALRPAGSVSDVSRTPGAQRVPSEERLVLAAPGRIEGNGETIDVGAAVDGVIAAVHVSEGDAVRRGTLLATIGCADLRAAAEADRSQLESVRQARIRLLRGTRDEERLAAAEQVRAAKAVLAQAEARLSRIRQLHASGDMAQAVLDEVTRDHQVAAANLNAAQRNEELVQASPVPEDVRRADADVVTAERRVQIAEQRLAKCFVRAPIDGVVVRVHLRPGQSFSTIAPHPLMTVADVSVRRVRAEVDERDVGRVRTGQNVSVHADAFPGRHFSGTVSQLLDTMGRKTVRTGDPGDKSDRDVLEVLATLTDDAKILPLGLRVTVRFTD